MGKRYPHDPASAQTAPNGATTYRSYRGAPGALIHACPVDGHAVRLSVQATDRQGVAACTRVRGVHVVGRIAWRADGPVFQPAGALPPAKPRKPRGPGLSLGARPAKRGADAHASGFAPMDGRVAD